MNSALRIFALVLSLGSVAVAWSCVAVTWWYRRRLAMYHRLEFDLGVMTLAHRDDPMLSALVIDRLNSLTFAMQRHSAEGPFLSLRSPFRKAWCALLGHHWVTKMDSGTFCWRCSKRAPAK